MHFGRFRDGFSHVQQVARAELSAPHAVATELGWNRGHLLASVTACCSSRAERTSDFWSPSSGTAGGFGHRSHLHRRRDARRTDRRFGDAASLHARAPAPLNRRRARQPKECRDHEERFRHGGTLVDRAGRAIGANPEIVWKRRRRPFNSQQSAPVRLQDLMQLEMRTAALTRADIMTAREVADFLRMPLSTVYDLARRGLLPAHRIGRAWRFVRQEIEAWLLAS